MSSHSQKAAKSPSPEGVLSKAVVRSAELLNLQNNVLAKILGVSEATASRLRSGSYTLKKDYKEFELGQLFVRVARSLDAITGSDEETSQSWLSSENLLLKGKPIELMQTIPGLMSTLTYVDSRRAKI
jgi:hypothetical protein